MMSDIIQEVLPEVNFGVMSGPNLAVEIMDNMPTAAVIASASEPLRKLFKPLYIVHFSCFCQ